MTDTQHLVLVFFEDEKAADRAVEALQAWDKCSDEIKYGAIGVLVKGSDGKLKEHKFGPRQAGKGAGIGVILGLVAVLLPGVGLLGGVVAGAALGAIGGGLTHEGLGLSKQDLQRIAAELDAGHAAVGAMAGEDERQATMDFLESWNGRAEAHEVTAAVTGTAAAEPPPGSR
jgi:uncharacterized membrane protein